ncbi:hypothetical protein [Frigidibacter sp. MR17.24]|uniref:hypothetical protein n=1 Tax=Frigidibacter sp. MR17.24 TaxID=3127345 RepID=UPI003012C774
MTRRSGSNHPHSAPGQSGEGQPERSDRDVNKADPAREGWRIKRSETDTPLTPEEKVFDEQDRARRRRERRQAQ